MAEGFCYDCKRDIGSGHAEGCHYYRQQRGPRYVMTLPDFTPHTLNQLTRSKRRNRIRLGKGDRDLVCYFAAGSGIPKATAKRRVTIRIVLAKGQRKADVDAYYKGMLDYLKHARLIVNDTDRWCQVMPVEFDRGPRRMTVVTLEDLD